MLYVCAIVVVATDFHNVRLENYRVSPGLTRGPERHRRLAVAPLLADRVRPLDDVCQPAQLSSFREVAAASGGLQSRLVLIRLSLVLNIDGIVPRALILELLSCAGPRSECARRRRLGTVLHHEGLEARVAI